MSAERAAMLREVMRGPPPPLPPMRMAYGDWPLDGDPSKWFKRGGVWWVNDGPGSESRRVGQFADSSTEYRPLPVKEKQPRD